MNARMTTLQVGEIVQTGDSRRGIVVEIDRSGSTSWCVRVRMNANGLVVGYRPQDLTYVGPATEYADDRPTAPYAVMCGLDGGYIPNSVYHYETLADALSAARDDLDRAADHLAHMGDEIEPEESAILEEIDQACGAIDAATTRGDLSEFAQGFSWQIARYESITLTPISPEDYDPEGME